MTTTEYFIWQWGTTLEIRRGTPAEHGYHDVVDVAEFNLVELGNNVAVNHAFALLGVLQAQGNAVNWSTEHIYVDNDVTNTITKENQPS